MSAPIKIIIVEDSEDDAVLVQEQLIHEGFSVSVTRVQTATELTDALTRGEWDVVLSDYSMPRLNGRDALRLVREHSEELPFLIVSGSIGEETAVEIMRAGANDYILKENLARLGPAVTRELKDARQRAEKRSAEREVLSKNRELEAQARQLYQSNKDLERFAYIAAHDLQEPLRLIASFSQLLVRCLGARVQDVPEATKYVEMMRSGVHRMEQLIDGLLKYARVVHQDAQNIEPVDMNAAFEEARSMLAQTIEVQQATVTVGPLPTVNGDRVQLVQVLQNLISNALKYRRPEAAPVVHLSAELQDTHWLFTVADNGIGIAPEHHDRVFEIFRRLHRTEYPGLGIGLASTKRLVDLHGGRIWVETDVGQGATFRFTLPASQAK